MSWPHSIEDLCFGALVNPRERESSDVGWWAIRVSEASEIGAWSRALLPRLLLARPPLPVRTRRRPPHPPLLFPLSVAPCFRYAISLLPRLCLFSLCFSDAWSLLWCSVGAAGDFGFGPVLQAFVGSTCLSSCSRCLQSPLSLGSLYCIHPTRYSCYQFSSWLTLNLGRNCFFKSFWWVICCSCLLMMHYSFVTIICISYLAIQLPLDRNHALCIR